MTDAVVVLCSFPDGEQARQIGAVLVERQVAACVSVLAGARSIYRWKGAVEEEGEVLALIKTTRAALPGLERLLHERHPYEVPEFLALPVVAGSAAYLEWLAAETVAGD